MSKEKETKNESAKKMTKYEKKQAARIAQQKKEAKAAKITKLALAVICVCLVAAIVFSIANPIISRQKAVNDTYVKIGNHEVTKVEYDYYYNTVINNYLNMYSSFLPYMGLDTSKDYDEQQYSDNMTWKDAFDEMAVSQLIQVKALVDDSQAQGFTYDTAEDYKSFQESLEAAAAEAEISVKEYYQKNYGEYATEASIEPFEKESLLAAAYYKELLEKNKPSEDEITSYYQEHKDDYDSVAYRSFTFSATVAEDATDEEKAAAMEAIKQSAEEMKTKREAGEDFEALCIQYASEEDKSSYEDEETEYSLTEGGKKSTISSSYSDWLYEEGRQERDITVISDEASNQCYVVEFVSRTYDENTDSSISDTLAQETVSEYVENISEAYEVTDVAGKLKYLTIPEEEEEGDLEETDTSEETVSDNQTE